MGKTMGGAVWLDPDKTSPFEFYQYWRNVDDADVINCLRKMTFLPLEQIDEMATWKDAKLNEAKDILAYELTSLVHGEEEAKKAREGARAIFGGAGDADSMPTTEISSADLTDGKADVVKLLVLTGLCSSNGDARRNIQQGGVSVDDEKITDIAKAYTEDELKKGVIIRKGKKTFNKVVLK
jgi:tyrosyl-tRNA synthetase